MLRKRNKQVWLGLRRCCPETTSDVCKMRVLNALDRPQTGGNTVFPLFSDFPQPFAGFGKRFAFSLAPCTIFSKVQCTARCTRGICSSSPACWRSSLPIFQPNRKMISRHTSHSTGHPLEIAWTGGSFICPTEIRTYRITVNSPRLMYRKHPNPKSLRSSQR